MGGAHCWVGNTLLDRKVLGQGAADTIKRSDEKSSYFVGNKT
jgi:hypothetical protein